MTPAQITTLKGDALNIAVAEMMGHEVVLHEPVTGEYGPHIVREGHWARINGKTYPLLDQVPDYAGDIRAALDVADWMAERADVSRVRVDVFADLYACGVDAADGGESHYRTGSDLCMAICQAALFWHVTRGGSDV